MALALCFFFPFAETHVSCAVAGSILHVVAHASAQTASPIEISTMKLLHGKTLKYTWNHVFQRKPIHEPDSGLILSFLAFVTYCLSTKTDSNPFDSGLTCKRSAVNQLGS